LAELPTHGAEQGANIVRSETSYKRARPISMGITDDMLKKTFKDALDEEKGDNSDYSDENNSTGKFIVYGHIQHSILDTDSDDIGSDDGEGKDAGDTSGDDEKDDA